MLNEPLKIKKCIILGGKFSQSGKCEHSRAVEQEPDFLRSRSALRAVQGENHN